MTQQKQRNIFSCLPIRDEEVLDCLGRVGLLFELQAICPLILDVHQNIHLGVVAVLLTGVTTIVEWHLRLALNVPCNC